MKENKLLEELLKENSIDDIQKLIDNYKKDEIKKLKNQFKEGELVCFIGKDSENNIYKIEVGKIKRLCDDGAFIWYHTGDTAAKTNYKDLYKIDNEYAINNLGGQNDE